MYTVADPDPIEAQSGAEAHILAQSRCKELVNNGWIQVELRVFELDELNRVRTIPGWTNEPEASTPTVIAKGEE